MSLNLIHLWADVYGLKLPKDLSGETPDKSVLSKQLKNALLEARSRGAKELRLRFFKDNHAISIGEILQSLGFRKNYERIEFNKTVEQLRDDEGTPLRWNTAQELGLSPEAVAKCLDVVAEGDPGHDPSEKSIEFIQDFLADPILTSGYGCIHLAFFRDEFAAMTVVQINPQNGWSRISYMGVAPKFRKQGLGVWVHRFSFAQMRREGGIIYHGGTTAKNKAMLALFRRHQCEVFQEVEEWSFAVSGAPV